MSNLKSMNSYSFVKRIVSLFCFAVLSCGILFADTGDDYETEESDGKFSTIANMNEPGDQYIKIGLCVTKPLNFDGTLLLGGAGELGYHRFITKNLLWGIDVSFGYNPTIGENIFTYIPFMFNLTYQPVFKKIEVPISVGVGASVENYLSNSYFPGLTLKGAVGAFYRMSPSWSFGLEGQFMCMPQWYSDSKNNEIGLFGSVQIAARYHF